jgi:membrane-associated protein
VDVVSALASAVHSVWLLPVLVVMIAVDAPFPVLPSETLLMTAVAVAFADDDLAVVVALFAAAVVGSVAGDLVTFGLGRTSHRIVAVNDSGSGARWIGRHLLRRPGIALVGARFVPGGRLVSTAAAGRFGLPLRRFVPWSVASSVAWSAYMLGVGRALEPVTGGNPLLCVVGGTVLAVLTGGLFALAQAVRRRRTVRV